MRHPQLDEILGKLRLYLEDSYGDRLEQTILYGSQARGDATVDSDIDVLIVLADNCDSRSEIDRTTVFFSDLCMDYGVLVSQVFAHRDWVECKPNPFYLNLRQEGVSV
jgi:predicted nucleotidyltransferase